MGKSIKIKYSGCVYSSKNEFYKKLNLDKDLIRQRVEKLGWPLKKAVETPKVHNYKRKLYKLKGKKIIVKEEAKKLGLSYKAVISRLASRRGNRSLEQALGLETFDRGKGPYQIKIGKKLYNLKKACKILGLKYGRTIDVVGEWGIPFDIYFRQLKKQKFKCYICKKKSSSKRQLVVDHNHKNNVIRGLICPYCNFVIGNAKDDIKILKNCIKYLKNYPFKKFNLKVTEKALKNIIKKRKYD